MTTSLPQEPVCLPQRIWKIAAAASSSRPSKPSYPPVSSIPRTSSSRLAAASPDSPSHDDAAQSTILYLAYGSNLSAATFLGARGIRPVSQVNVSAPSLSLVFDLPGLPYREPCFANSAPRKVPKLPDPSDPPKFPPIPPPPQPPASAADLGWDRGLFGVVYEVTREDYATILATEGGGSSYADILTPCIPLPPRVSIPEKPPIDIPRPFFAHTLCSPTIPDADPESPGAPPIAAAAALGDDPKRPEDPRKKWYWRFLRPARRPDPTYAQPSARYLKLITDGAAEHELPDDYQRWLNSLRPYTVTTWRQQIGRWLLTASFLPVVILFFVLNKLIANKEGRVPLWLGVTLGAVFNLLWMAYDCVLKPVFGDGERTQEEEEEEKDEGRVARRRRRSWRRRSTGVDEEKLGLLEDMD